MARLSPKRFHPSTYQKVQAKKTGPLRVLKWLCENAYLLELPSDLHFSPIFNVEDLCIYHGHQNDAESSATRWEEEEKKKKKEKEGCVPGRTVGGDSGERLAPCRRRAPCAPKRAFLKGRRLPSGEAPEGGVASPRA
uniref:Tf2-1-like SH3-like domain-containing protein n=1 Tax=Vitis vinifera TaxID=29760 RepID=A5BW77_VITVI|nr:hypothetical protein VITISV_007951 [Vitis vinifera]